MTKRQPAGSVRLGEDAGHPALLVNGVVQSIAADGAADGYWASMLPSVRPGAALLLGLGAGTVAHLLTRRFGPLPIVGVDDDSQVIALGRAVFGLDLPHLEIVVQDAFVYVTQCRERFDYVGVDLYRGGRMPRGVLGRPFLRQVRALASPRGLVAINLFMGEQLPRQVARLGEALRVVKQVAVDENVVVHCRPR